jgi:hypothetical protein
MVREEKSWRAKDTSSTDFWGPLFKHQPFRDAIKNRYQLGAIETNAVVDEEVDALINSKIEVFHAPEGEVRATPASVEDELESYEDEE